MAALHDITATITGRFAAIEQNERSDDHSWEHCYEFFSGDPADFDLASLHLGFYLASWGMYRGSTSIRRCDYLIHRPIVEVLLSREYKCLRGASLEALQRNIDRLWELVGKLKARKPNNLYPEDVTMTDALVTKILMGTLGCTPAYDRFFVCGLKANGLAGSFSRKSFGTLLECCRQYELDFSVGNSDYPIMLKVDMFFHAVGRKKSE